MTLLGNVRSGIGAVPLCGSLTVVSRSVRSIGPEWQAFAEENGGSFRSLPDKLRLASVLGILRGRVQAFEFFVDAPGVRQKIGQCWITRQSDRIQIGDGLQILPHYASLWPDMLRVLLDRLGPGRYEYGWAWSLEQPRTQELVTVPGVTIASVMEFAIHYINFSDWASWDDYYAAISENVRRNIRKAGANRPSLAISENSGRSGIRDIRSLVALRKETFARLGSRLNIWQAMASYTAQLLAAPMQMVSMVAEDMGTPLAGLLGYEFGKAFFYWQGGSVADQSGSGWSLLIAAVKRWYDRHPDGLFILGYFNPDLPGTRREGLLRQRQSLRKRDARTAVLVFDYAPARTA